MTPDLHHLAAAYALDALDDVERRAFENHYPTCDICSGEVRDFREVAGHLASSVAHDPSSDLKASVMAEIAQTRQLSPIDMTPKRGMVEVSRRALFAAAAALVLLGGVAAAVATRSDTNDAYAEIAAAPDRVITTLDGVAEGQAGNLQVVWSDERDQVIVIGSDLDEIRSDQAYALWFLVDDGVAPAGLFRPDNGSISVVLDVEDIATNGWGITVEPAAGSPQPTSDVLFAGLLS